MTNLSKSKSILYQNADHTVTLIDIPQSIAEAQVLTGEPLYNLLSSEPIREPYRSIEPKSEKAKANVLARQGPSDYERYKQVISRGLEQISTAHRGPWCVKRSSVDEDKHVRRRKRKFGAEEQDAPSQVNHEPNSDNHERNIKASGDIPSLAATLSSNEEFLTDKVILKPDTVLDDIGDVFDKLVCNPGEQTILMSTAEPHSSYQIPPQSRFCLAEIDEGNAEHCSKILFSYEEHALASLIPGQFDIVVLDPPWHNRSVARSGHYQTQRDDPLIILKSMLGKHIRLHGIVACWITNKDSARAAALQAFEAWNISLIEEWIWLKVTGSGEPVYQVDGIWRRPFEVLLVGRKSDIDGSPTDAAELADEVGQRVIVAVPDLHSRKPCLKSLLQPLLRDQTSYQGLEIFARNLVASWWSWGNDVLKFNEVRNWIETVEEVKSAVPID
ncbi:Methyltransferase-like protein 4 [Agyrium rufum]|nr:Methyltransferase-like protein 4 [Agyrium rufum]